MNTVMTKERLEQILDQALQDVTERTAGVRLNQENQPLGKDFCTVHITFDWGFSTSLTLCAKGFVDKPFHQEQLIKVFEQALL